VELSWKNPDDSDFSGTLIVCRNDRYPADYDDGTVVCDLTNSPGSQDTFLHSGLQNGNQYYYAAFAYDTDGNYSGPAYASATPNGIVSEPDISLSETGHNYGPVEIGSYSDWTLVIENKNYLIEIQNNSLKIAEKKYNWQMAEGNLIKAINRLLN